MSLISSSDGAEVMLVNRASAIAVIGLVVVVLTGLPTVSAPANGSFPLHSFPFVFYQQRLVLSEWDFGQPLGCAPRKYVGLVLRNGAKTIWAFRDVEYERAVRRSGCRGMGGSLAQIAAPGVAEIGASAHFVVAVLVCGGSCAGYTASAFGVQRDVQGIHVYRELRALDLGPGGDQVRFHFPILTLYRNNSYHDCPSNWTKITYLWSGTSGYSNKSTVTYSSSTCYFHQPSDRWPPEPPVN